MFGLSYWFLPLFAGCVWLGTLLAMLGRWIAIGSPHYPWTHADQHVAYISDIASSSWGYPLFIAGSAVSVVVFDLAFLSERWLRHKGRLQQNYNNTEKILSVLATLSAIVGAAGLILLTIFKVATHPHVHDAMLVVFIAGYIVSAIFVCAEYQRLGIHYREHAILAYSFWVKLAFIFIEVGLVIAFGVLSYNKHYNKAAVLEWVISLVYIFYQISYVMDFLPARKTKNDRFLPPVRRQDDEMAMTTEAQGNMMGGPVYSSGGINGDGGSSHGSQVPMTQNQRHYAPQAPSSVSASHNF